MVRPAVDRRWRFEPGEALDDSFRRVASREIRAARAALNEAGENFDTGIHEARRSFKRLRSLLRLASPALDPCFAQENRRLRDAGRALSPARDSAVLFQSFDSLAKSCTIRLASADMAALRLLLPQEAAAPPSALQDQVVDVAVMAGRIERNLAQLTWPSDANALHPGLQNMQKRLKASFRAARARGDSIDLHTWRKQIKVRIAQTEIFTSVVPKRVKADLALLKRTAQILGDEHDLYLLGTRLEVLEVAGSVRTARNRLVELVEERRRKLRRKALHRGEAFSTRAPNRIARELCAAWEVD